MKLISVLGTGRTLTTSTHWHSSSRRTLWWTRTKPNRILWPSERNRAEILTFLETFSDLEWVRVKAKQWARTISSIPRATQTLAQWKLSAWERKDGDSDERERGIARDKSLRLREQLNHVEIMSVYLKMIGREQKEWTVGGGEISQSRGAAGVSQTDSSVLTLWWLKTAAGAWCGPGNVVNNIRYYLWTWVMSLCDSQKQ